MWNQRERERVEEIVSTYVVLTRDHFLSTLSRDLHRHLNMVTFINTFTQGWQLTSGQVTKVFTSGWRYRYFLLTCFCTQFPLSYILVISFLISMCHDHLVNWPVNLSPNSYFRNSVPSSSFKLLVSKAFVLLTKNPFATFQSTDNTTKMLGYWKVTKTRDEEWTTIHQHSF